MTEDETEEEERRRLIAELEKLSPGDYSHDTMRQLRLALALYAQGERLAKEVGWFGARCYCGPLPDVTPRKNKPG